MSRLRARLARSGFDAEVQQHLARAEREIRAALALADGVKREGGVEAYRARRVRRDLLQVLGSMESVRRLTPIRDETAEVPYVRPERPERPPRPEIPLKPPSVIPPTDIEVP